MEYAVQQLGENDVKLLRQLNKLFGDVFEDIKTYDGMLPSDAYLTSFLGSSDTIVLVATISDTVVGGLVAYTLNKFEMERKELYLYDLAVSREQQRKGIGKRLVEELVGVARAMGAYVVFVQADEGEDAVTFYESLSPDENIRTRSFDYVS